MHHRPRVADNSRSFGSTGATFLLLDRLLGDGFLRDGFLRDGLLGDGLKDTVE